MKVTFKNISSYRSYMIVSEVGIFCGDQQIGYIVFDYGDGYRYEFTIHRVTYLGHRRNKTLAKQAVKEIAVSL